MENNALEETIQQKQSGEMSILQQKSEMEIGWHPDTEEPPGSVPPAFIQRARDLFVRAPQNPLLTPQDMPFPCKSVCNPGACLVDGEVLLLLRVIDEQDHSASTSPARRMGSATGALKPCPCWHRTATRPGTTTGDVKTRASRICPTGRNM